MNVPNEGSALDNIIVKPVYLRAVNAIVQPELQVPCSAYFFRNWLPRLGTLRWCLVLTLRSICTQRQPDGTNRGEICRGDLAALVGVHEATISRILNSSPSSINRGWRVLASGKEHDPETTLLSRFIPRLRYKYERDAEAGVTRRVGYVIDVVMDDPLIPEDEERLAVTLAEQLLQASASASKELTNITDWENEGVAPQQPAKPSKQRATASRTTSPTRNSKTHNAISHSSVKQQLVTDTINVERQLAPSTKSVSRYAAPAKGVTERDAPVLTLTNNYKYKNLDISLNLSRKRDIRAALKPLVEYAATSLQDEQSKGLYYATLTQLYPDNLDVFVTALESAQRQGRRRKSVNMGAAFVRAIREAAAEEEIALKLGSSEVRPDDVVEDTVEDEVDPSPKPRPSRRVAQKGAESRHVLGSRLTTKQLWISLLEELRTKTSKASYEMWLRNCSIARVEADTVVIATPSAFAREWVNDRLLSIIRRALKQVVGREMNVRCEALPAAGARKKLE